jgi:hypothetical protein
MMQLPSIKRGIDAHPDKYPSRSQLDLGARNTHLHFGPQQLGYSSNTSVMSCRIPIKPAGFVLIYIRAARVR